MPDAAVSWKPTKKMRLALAGILTADAVQLAAWISDNVTGKVALATIVLATAGGIAGYLQSDGS